MPGKILYIVLAVLFAAAIGTGASHASGKKALGIAVGVAATALIIAAAKSANAHVGNDDYDYHHGIGGPQNAVAACIHKADRRVRKKRRGRFARLDDVKDVKNAGGVYKVTMLVTNVFENRRKRRWVKCHVDHDRVVFFKYN